MVDPFAEFRRQRQHLARQRAAQADPVGRAGELQIGLDVEIQHGHRRLRLVVGNGRQRGVETGDVAVDDRNPEIGLGREMIMDAGLADSEAVGDVLVAEGAVAAGLDQRLGEIEDLLGGL